MKFTFYTGGNMLTIIFAAVYGLITAFMGILAIEHWYWWPGCMLAGLIGKYFDVLLAANE